MTTPAPKAPAWFRELEGTLGVNPQFVLEGNVTDRYLLPGGEGRLRPVAGLVDAVWAALAPRGYEALIVYDPTDGLHVHPQDDAAREVASRVCGRNLAEDRNPLTLDGLREALPGILGQRDHRIAVIVDQAARLAPDPEHLTPEQLAFFTAAERLALTAGRFVPPSAASEGGGGDADGESVALFNSLIWVVRRDRELPSWLIAHADHVRSIALPLPDYSERERCAEMLLGGLDGFGDADAARRRELIDRFTQQTEGMSLNALFSIALLAVHSGEGVDGLGDAARAYRVGIVDNPWRTDHLRGRLANGEEAVNRRVIGQGDAVRKSLDIMIRSATGLTGAHRSPYATRPRGVIFLAGPTGVGKTELAKQLTELVFGDESAYIRFDMSEFSEEHNAARLIGAPPGYTGYDAGGELTNALRERPFSLVLFDEIEKAHGRILDKFLQILEDGRLTDGRGATVFFSEAILVFTSNLGIWVHGEDGAREANVTPEMDRELAEQRILAAIKHHFTAELGRPELLNRLGDNIVVFDFISRESGVRILDLLIDTVIARVEREHRATLQLDPAAREQLEGFALGNLENGGRGIGAVVENGLVNPLARAIFERDVSPGDVLRVTSVSRTGRTYELTLA